LLPVVSAATLDPIGRQEDVMVDPGLQEILDRYSSGDKAAADELLRRLYDQLHRVAKIHMRGERPAHTLQATALVNEAWFGTTGESR
jgi:hypothetical protein